MVKVVGMLCEGMGIRAISRLTRLDQKTVLRILETAGGHCARLLDAKVRNLHVVQVQTDEIWSMVFCKGKNTVLGDLERGDLYTFLSVDRDSKLIINHHIGKRNTENAFALMRDLKTRIDGQFQLSTDAFRGFCGSRGSVLNIFGQAIHYGWISKVYGSETAGRGRYSPPICLYVKKRAMIGNPDPAMICTSHVERTNLSIRLFNRRFTRLTMGYSKKLDNLKYAVALFIAHFNFCRVHNTIKRTPAQAAGLTDHAWAIEELLTK